MINIRPVSDLRNKYPEIEELVLKEDEAVYLTKNGYGSMVVMSLKQYAKIIDESKIERAIKSRFSNIDIERVLKEIDEEISKGDTKYLTHEEVFGELRRRLYEQ